VHELPTATEDKSNTAQQTRATGTARDGVVVHAITKTNEKTNPSVSTILYASSRTPRAPPVHSRTRDTYSCGGNHRMEKPATAPHALSESLTLTSYYVYTRKREHDRRTAAAGAHRRHVQNVSTRIEHDDGMSLAMCNVTSASLLASGL